MIRFIWNSSCADVNHFCPSHLANCIPGQLSGFVGVDTLARVRRLRLGSGRNTTSRGLGMKALLPAAYLPCDSEPPPEPESFPGIAFGGATVSAEYRLAPK
jgi:hypothetical protein